MSSGWMRGRRLIATLIDLLLLGLASLFIMLASGVVESAEAWVMPQPIIRLTALIVITYLLLNGYFLLKSGQTIGKRWLRLTIVHANTETQLGPWRLALRAYGVLLVALSSGTLVHPLLFVAVVGLEVLPIFGPTQRCLHDYLAGSAVIKVASAQQ